MKKNVLVIVLVLVLIVWGVLGGLVFIRQKDKNYYDLINAVSGATPLAVAQKVPETFTLIVDGLVKKQYRFTSSALNGFASTRIRTREVDEKGQFLGAYVYVGIPVFNILEGIAPQKPSDTQFNQPLDILVTFESASGQTRHFSFNEILMADDVSPITLAFHRNPLAPTTEEVRATYAKNLFPQPLDGLRLIVPQEPDTRRYLDHVVRITYTVPSLPEAMLPPRRKGVSCESRSLTCIEGERQRPAGLDRVARARNARWIMIGHGHGYEKTAAVEGYDLRSFIKTNFAACTDSDFFLFAACDGYRCLFSGREIFATEKGASMMIVDQMNGQWPDKGFRLAPTADFFADRSMWAVAYAVRLPITPNSDRD